MCEGERLVRIDYKTHDGKEYNFAVNVTYDADALMMIDSLLCGIGLENGLTDMDIASVTISKQHKRTI